MNPTELKGRSAPVPGFPNVRAGEDGVLWLWGSCWERVLPKSQGRVWVRADHGKGVHVRAARLVCAAWHGAPQPRWAVMYDDGNPANLKPSNLSWSRQQRTGTRRKVCGFAEEEIRERAAAGETLAALAREFKVSVSTVSAVCKGRVRGGKSVARTAQLTPEQRAEVIRLRRAGVKELAVAVRFKRSPNQITRIMRAAREQEQQPCSPSE
jgi:hypothetical protein